MAEYNNPIANRAQTRDGFVEFPFVLTQFQNPGEPPTRILVVRKDFPLTPDEDPMLHLQVEVQTLPEGKEEWVEQRSGREVWMETAILQMLKDLLPIKGITPRKDQPRHPWVGPGSVD